MSRLRMRYVIVLIALLVSRAGVSAQERPGTIFPDR
jgi:hypothetical protein